jgi:hypothetical protein
MKRLARLLRALAGRIDPDGGRGCLACSDADYGMCTCRDDCGHLNCTGGRH